MHQTTKSLRQRITAPVKFYSRDKGFGFIKRPDAPRGTPDIFFSAMDLEAAKINVNSIGENDMLEFDLIPVEGKGGKAKNLKLIAKGNRDAR